MIAEINPHTTDRITANNHECQSRPRENPGHDSEQCESVNGREHASNTPVDIGPINTLGQSQRVTRAIRNMDHVFFGTHIFVV